MTCHLAQALIDKLADHELSAEVSVDLHNHLKQCSICRVEFEDTVRLRELLAARPVPQPAEGYFHEVQQLIMARTVESEGYTSAPGTSPSQVSDQRSAFMRSVVAVAASLLILFSALMLGSWQESRTAGLESDPAALVAATVAGPGLELLGLSIADTPTQPELAPFLVVGPPGMLGRMTDFATVQGGE